MLRLYKNKFQTFECSIEIEGADTSEATSRIILYPTNDTRNIMYSGKVVGNTCIVDINSNVNVAKTGTVVLEIIVDNSLVFNPWEDSYEIVDQVKIHEASINYNSKARVMPTVKVSGLSDGTITVREDTMLKVASVEDKASSLFSRVTGKQVNSNLNKTAAKEVKVSVPVEDKVEIEIPEPETIEEEIVKEAVEFVEEEVKIEVKKEEPSLEDLEKEATKKVTQKYDVSELNIFSEFG